MPVTDIGSGFDSLPARWLSGEMTEPGRNFVYGCGECLVALKPGSDDLFTCPKCGRSDTIANVEKEIGDCLQDQMDMRSMLEGVLANNSRLEGNVKETASREYRFVPLNP